LGVSIIRKGILAVKSLALRLISGYTPNMPTAPLRLHSLTVRIPPKHLTALAKEAAREGRTVAAQVRKILADRYSHKKESR